ncbi:hypothetical protein [Rhizobium rhizoryzae]|jgi:hypothetical protein|uniref:Uncharacterized protein n=1 Tax=Rhizobium rhizoryzae TaxID=451876 RepID=A0A7W6LJK2_9HYPH|nr:hypothetical protein [Rhizobium rhizoryzae]MBB4145550.1 hypothetical protein [Rhizobium rhizoryzae]
MTEHLQELSGNGRLSLGGEESSVGYKLVATQQPDQQIVVAVSVMAPRDWLLKQGFEREATLHREAGEDLDVALDGQLDVSHPISVTLRSEDQTFSSLEAARAAFPELGRMRD